MLINVTLDAEDPLPLDAEEALGNIMIADETGSTIRQESIWVDDWLVALVSGSEALAKGEEIFSADIESEPNPILFQREGKRIALSFADTTVTGNLTEFRSELQKAVQKMLSAFDSDVSFRPDSFWAQLQKFAR
jgi:hypothetical protein